MGRLLASAMMGSSLSPPIWWKDPFLAVLVVTACKIYKYTGRGLRISKNECDQPSNSNVLQASVSSTAGLET